MENGVRGATDRHGNPNGSLYFDGANDYINLSFQEY